MKQPILKIQKFTGKSRKPRKEWKPAYFFRIVAANGEIIAQSEAYTTARARNKTVRLLVEAKIVERKRNPKP